MRAKYSSPVKLVLNPQKLLAITCTYDKADWTTTRKKKDEKDFQGHCAEMFTRFRLESIYVKIV